MKDAFRFVAGVGLFLALTAQAWAGPALVNQLRNHASPYLALHGEDPVAWQDWGPGAVAAAREGKRLLYISSGYFSCHWCHVMQQESYRNPEIAAFLNEHFVPVKIDRELEPALDARMIEFVEATRGMSGWPLNVFFTPQGDPLYGVLYLPPDQFLVTLKRLQGLWDQDPAGLSRIAAHEAHQPSGPGEPEVNPAQAAVYARGVVSAALELADIVHGGFGEQSKFPSVPQLEFLLAENARRPDPRVTEFLVLTLDSMARYGLHDHLGGGFFRYTVDPDWRTPHFEKMLYDNALLARLYLRAGKALDRPDYLAIARRTLDFMLNEMRAPGGGFIAALSALDDKGVEGGYYLWDRDVLAVLLTPEEHEAYTLAWSMGDAPPFDAGYLPVSGPSVDDIAARLQIDAKRVGALLDSAATKLRAARVKRGLPRDTKVLAAWNGLALSALAEASRVTGKQEYREAAAGVRDYIVQTLWDGRTLERAVAGRGGRALGRPSVEDYAYVAEGMAAWAALTGRPEDYAQAKAVVEQAWSRFYGSAGWRMGELSLIGAEAGQDVLLDGPMPSPSGVLAEVSLELAAATGDEALRRRALGALNSGHAELADNGFWYATQIGALRRAADGVGGSAKPTAASAATS
jgi:uncharacterized protein YyaL (SSP411 family)